jgi:hypothetical protein
MKIHRLGNKGIIGLLIIEMGKYAVFIYNFSIKCGTV